MLEMGFKILDVILPTFFNRRRLRVRVHRAYFVGSHQECFVVSLTNRSSTRDLEVTQVWFQGDRDRKSTRLNSSHRTISYAVFCLKKTNIMRLSISTAAV